MSTQDLPYNFVVADPDLPDALRAISKNIFLNLNTHHIGTIQSFDETKQTAKVTINYTKTYFEQNKTTGVYSMVQEEYPIMADCPVICLGGSTAALTFPIQKGDECLVLFNDRDIDNWFEGSTTSSPNTSRLHSFSDAIILVGVRSKAKAIQNYDTTRAVLRNGQALVGVGPVKVKVANNSTSLNTQLQNLVTHINSLVTAVNTLVTQTAAITVTCATPGNPSTIPINAAAITAISSTLSTIATELSNDATGLGGLLE